MKLRVSHLTRYQYEREVSLSPHILYLRPRETPRLRLHRFTCNVSPFAKLDSILDAHDNVLTWAHFWEPSDALNIRTEFEIETLDTNAFDFVLKSYAVTFPFLYEPVFGFALAAYLAPPYDATQASLRNWLDEHLIDRSTETVPLLTALNQLVFDTLAYTRRDEHGIQPSLMTLQLGTGACRDYAVLFVELCRTLGFAARFVSGYMFAPAGDDHRTAGAMHAWAEVYLPGAGWKGLDPTHGIWCDDAFIPVAHAAQAENVNPVQGSYASPVAVASKLHTDVIVERLA